MNLLKNVSSVINYIGFLIYMIFLVGIVIIFPIVLIIGIIFSLELIQINGFFALLMGIGLIVFAYCIINYYFKPIMEKTEKFSDKTKELIKNYPNLGSDQTHHAIIIAHPKPRILKIRGYIIWQNKRKESYSSGEDLLIEKFQNPVKKINYAIYEVNSKEQVLPLIQDPKITHLWIFGHGQRDKLDLEMGTLYYSDTQNTAPKKFIGQYHCNSWLGKSLADYNHPKNQDVTRWPRIEPLIRASIKRKLIELESENLLE
jgi:hypothetical protein